MDVQIKDKSFQVFIREEEIKLRLRELGNEISKDFLGQELVMLGVLNGSFIIFADLCREVQGVKLLTSFIRISSYSGTESQEKVKEVMGLNDPIEGKNVLIVEDIVDTGISMNFLLNTLKTHNPASVSIATLLFKPDAFRFNYPLHYVGFEIPNKFVVGYGLDYDGYGRELPEIYQLK
jgi:hypoxanthine phosphoribosyltransferase